MFVICDIDGTIANLEHRLGYILKEPKDWNSFYKECVNNEPISNVIKLLHLILDSEYDHDLIFCTGRSDTVRKETETWLRTQELDDFGSVTVLMRADGDHRHDTEVKPELLDEMDIKPQDVLMILEDRTSMVKKWRELGYTCFQVADGDF